MHKRYVFFLLCIGFQVTLSAQAIVLNNPSACNLGLPIKDGQCPDDNPFFNPNLFKINVQNAPGTRLGIDVYLKEIRLLLPHEWAGDLEVRLSSPSGKQILLTDDNGGSNDNYGDPAFANCEGAMTFSLSACVPITNGERAKPPFTDQDYRAMESLLAFNDSLTNPNGLWTLSICDDLEVDTGRLDFVELVFETLSCLPVTDVRALEQDSTTVVLDWSPAIDCDNVTTLIEYGPPGFIPGEGLEAGQGTVITAICPPYTLAGLAEETEYEIYIRKACVGGSFSGNTCGFRIRTGCQPPGPAVTESFDTENLCAIRCEESCPLQGSWRNISEDGLDWIAYQGPTPTQNTGPAAAVGGTGKYVYLETSGTNCPSGSTAVLLSDCFELQKRNTDSCHFSFYYSMNGVNVGSLRLEVTSNGGIQWDSLWQLSDNQGRGWKKVYLGLGDYSDGAILQFRFIGTKGNGSQGDIALDEITLHGSAPLGAPGFIYYVDQDNDGYGDTTVSIKSCLPIAPEGFVERAGDCNDRNPAVNPGAPEIPCDNLDNNCNGDADDLELPTPKVVGDTICSGELPTLVATPVSNKFIFWYQTPDDLLEIPEFGEIFSPELPPNNSSQPVVYRFYAEETDLRCFSAQRAEAVIVVHPRPRGELADKAEVCPGGSIDLARLPLDDVNRTGARIRFFDQLPLSGENELINTEVSPVGPTTYYYQMETDAGCTFEGTIPVSIKEATRLSFLPSADLTLCLENTEEVRVINAGNPDSRYLWSTGAETATIQVQAGTEAGENIQYSVTVTDGDGCVNTGQVNVRTTASIDSISRVVQNVTTCSGEDGAIRLTPLNGAPPFRYLWSGTNGVQGDSIVATADAFTITDLPQGTYRVTITDGSSQGCFFRMPPAYVNGPDAAVRDIQIRPVSCNGGNDGRIDLQVFGNPAYRWNTGATTSSIQGLSSGYYSVTVSDGDCESIIDSLEIVEPEPIKAIFRMDEPSCSDATDGSLSLNVFGGIPNYTYRWSTGALSPQVNDLPKGTYEVSITDAVGCVLEERVPLTAPAPVEAFAVTLDSISCAGFADGRILVDAKGGTAPFAFTWNTGSAAPELSGLAPGIYRVSVTDFNNCTGESDFAVVEPPPLTARLVNTTLPLCRGDETGEIRVRAVGGTAPYQFAWNTGQSGASVQGLGVGNYQVQALDANGCLTDSLEVILPASSNLRVETSIKAPTCVGLADGRIVLKPEGNRPFRYEWSAGDSTAVLAGLTPGTYAYTVVDALGCIQDSTVSLGVATQPIAAAFNVIEPSCAGSSDALVNVNITRAANQPLQFRWSDDFRRQDRQGIMAGDYLLTITDAIGCVWESDTVKVDSPVPLEYDLIGKGDIQCRGDTNGFLELGVFGGVPPYRYNWIGTKSNTNAAYNLPAGQYRVFIEDANGCPSDGTFNLPDPPELVVDIDLEEGNVCLGDSSNRLTLLVQGGRAPYTFQWSNGLKDSVVNNLLPGDYGVVIRDANQCRELLPSIKIRDPGQELKLDSFIVRNISCFGERDGQMRAYISGGAPPYNYLFSNADFIRTEDRSVRIRNLPADNDYQVTVSDAKGCIVSSARLDIVEPPLLNLRRDSIREIRCANGQDGGIFVTANGGTPPYAYSWYNDKGAKVAETEDLRFAGQGTYFGVVTDAGICSDTLRPVTLENNNPPIVVEDTLIENVVCRNDKDGLIQVVLSGGKPPFKYLWTNGVTQATNSGLGAGIYGVTITDRDLCRLELKGLEIAPAGDLLQLEDSIQHVQCAGVASGAIQVYLSGGIAPYRLSWSRDGDLIAVDTSLLTQLTGGIYVLDVIDSVGCTEQFSLPVLEPDSLQIQFAADPPGESGDDGRLLAEVSGGTPPYQYRWNTNDSINELIDIPVGLYQLTVTDTKNCIDSAQYELRPSIILNRQLIDGFRLFPNPASTAVQLDLRLRQSSSLVMELLDSNGKRLQQRRLPDKRRLQETVPLQGMPPGTYWIVLRDAQRRVAAAQLIIQ